MAAPPSRYREHLYAADDRMATSTTPPPVSPMSTTTSPFTPETPSKPPVSKYSSADNAEFQSIPVQDPSVERQWHSRAGRPHVFRLWKWEVGSLVVATGLMGCIIGLLAEYNGREVSEWHLSMNLSTLVALLSTVIRANIVMVVSSVISQLKWSWFTARAQPLKHLQDFDSGSRAGVGAVRLIWMLVRRGSRAVLLAVCAGVAALVVVLSFTVGPFMQQAIKTEICPRFLPNVNSSIPVVNYVMGDYFRIAAGEWLVSGDMRGSMVQGITNPQSQDFGIQASCPTGNCTFPDYGTGVTHASVGLCSRCVDRGADIKGPDENGTISVSASIASSDASADMSEDEYYYYNPWIILDSGQPFLNVKSLQGKQGVRDITVLAASNSPCRNTTDGMVCPHRNATVHPGDPLYGDVADYVAATCTLYPCIKSYSGSVADGRFNERVVATTEIPVTDLPISFMSTDNYTALLSPCVLDGTWYTEANMSSAPKVDGRTWDWVITPAGKNITVPNACLYKFNPVYAFAMSYSLTDVFNGTCTYDTRQGDGMWCFDTWYITSLFNKRNASLQSISTAMDGFASAITTRFRTSGWGPDEPLTGSRNGAGYAVRGTVLQNSICTTMDWRWLLLPCGLLAISAVLLVWMIARSFDRSRGEPLWKSNILPLVLYGLSSGAEPEKVQRRDTTLSGVEADAEAIKVRYVVGEGGRPGLTDETLEEQRAHVRRYSVDSLLQR